MKGTNATLLTLVTLLLLIIFGQRVGRGSATVPMPTVSTVTGSIWSYSCPRTLYNGYLQVPYRGRSDSGISPLTVNGTNLNLVTSCSLSATGYSVAITSKSQNRIVLDVRANSAAESPYPSANPTLYLISSSGVTTIQIRPGLIPALYSNTLDWGQCTWWAGGIARLRSGRSVVNAYARGVAINPDPTSPGFPKAGSVLMTYQKHMSYLENVRESSVANRDGSVTTTYLLTGSQYNANCDAQRSNFAATMIVIRRGNSYAFVSKPKVIFEVDRVAQ